MTTAAKTPTKTPAKKTTKAETKPITKAISKPESKPITKPISKIPATAAKPATAIKKIAVPSVASKNILKQVVNSLDAKPIKAKKIKLVRDSFTIPKPEYLILDNLKLRAADLKHPVKKSELLRAGIKALAAMTDAQLLLALRAVPMLKTGRPSK